MEEDAEGFWPRVVAETARYFQNLSLMMILVLALSLVSWPIIMILFSSCSVLLFSGRCRAFVEDAIDDTATWIIIPARKIGGQRKRSRFKHFAALPIVSVILSASLAKYPFSSSGFLGAVVDSGASKSCMGIRQARALCKATGQSMSLRPTTVRFRFGSGPTQPLGIMDVNLSTPGGPVSVPCHVVKNDVPLLLGLDFLDENQLYLRNTRNTLCSENGWSLPIARAAGHAWLRTGYVRHQSVYYTKPELAKLHRHFRHPGPGKLYDILRRTKPEDLSKNTLDHLVEISNACKTCTELSRKEVTFKARMKEMVVFNRKVALDLMYLDSRPVLHVVDRDTDFGAAKFVPCRTKNPTTAQVWETFVEMWALMYTGLPDIVVTDHASTFTSKDWKFTLTENRVAHVLTGVESHHSNGQVESAHAILRRTYRAVRKDHPKVRPELALAVARKTINETRGPKGLVPLLLVFGEMPSYRRLGLGGISDNKTRFNAMLSARREYLLIVNQIRARRTLRMAVPPAADRQYAIGDLVYVWREKEKTYTGPFTVSNVSPDNSQITVDDREDPDGGRFSSDCIRPAPSAEDVLFSEIAPLVEEHLSEAALAARQRARRVSSDDEVTFVTSAYGVENDDDSFPIYVSEVVHPKDPRADSKQFVEAKMKELTNLLQRGTFKVVLKEEVPAECNVMSSRIVLTIKDKDTDQERYKARFVVRGFSDELKEVMVHQSPNLGQDGTRMLFALASILGFEIWSVDVSQAFIQSASDNMRPIFCTGPAEMELEASEVLQLMRPLYGLCDSGDRWAHTLRHHHTSDLGMLALASEPALFYRSIGDRLIGLSGCYVDDMLRAGTPDFYGDANATSSTFDTTPPSRGKFSFMGTDVEQSGQLISADMTRYIKDLKQPDGTWSAFASARAKLAWIVYTRPDICASIAKLAQVTLEIFEKDAEKYTKTIVSLIKYVQSNPLKMSYPKLDLESLSIRAYSDASHASNFDGSSQLGYIVVLRDKHSRFSILQFKSAKCHRITKSAMAAETCAFVEAFDVAWTMKYELELLLKRQVPLQMLVDSKQLFQSISHGTRTKEKRLMIDLAASKQAFNRKEITDLGLVRTNHMLADCFTKVMKPTQLVDAMKSGILDHAIENWIVRS